MFVCFCACVICLVFLVVRVLGIAYTLCIGIMDVRSLLYQCVDIIVCDFVHDQ